MLRHVAAFELRYQLRSPVLWASCLIFFLMTFGSVTVDTIQIGGQGNVKVNAPFAILQTLAVMTLFATFVVVALVANVVVRDDETGFAGILRSTRLRRRDLVAGRYAGATAAALLVLAMMPLGILAGSAMPWLDPDKVGPFVPGHYLFALFGFALPTLLVMASIHFALATATRSMMWSYVGAVALLVLYIVMRGLLRDPAHDTTVALADPFGLATLSVVTKYWTAADRNSRLPEFTGVLLANRALWSAVGLALFGLAWARFRMTEAPGRVRAGRTDRRGDAAADEAGAAASGSLGTMARPGRDLATRMQQALALARFDMVFVFRSPAFFVLMLIGLFNAGAGLWFAGQWYGGQVLPVTRLMSETLLGAFSIIPIIVAIFYGGELVWRDRERRMHEIVDATAAPDWAFMLPKMVAIALVLVAMALVAVLGAMGVQLAKGYTRFEFGHYLAWFVLPSTLGAMLLAVLSVFVQVLVPQKQLGWGVMLVYVVASVALGSAGFEHRLYNYADVPGVPLSDMNGAGRFLSAQLWVFAYWSAFALVLAVLAHGLWRRGAGSTLRARLALLPVRLRGAPTALLATGAVAWAGLGGWVYYNTNVLNAYVPGPERERRMAEREKALVGFDGLPLPRIREVTLDVQLFPREVRAVTTGRYVIENPNVAPLDTLHVNLPDRLVLDRIDIPGATLEKDYRDFGYRIYKLDPPMAPGERRTVAFATTLAERGFPNSRPLTRIVENGTFLDNGEITPAFGFNRDRVLRDRAKRRKHGLPPDYRMPKLEEEGPRQWNGFRRDSDFVTADITVTTDADQTPIAPGRTLGDTTAGGRRTVRFRSDAPINHFFSIQSGRYAVAKDEWNGVALAVYHHPGHDLNVPRMLAAMKTSLQIFSERFSPYQFRQARILEFPAYADFAQSFANTIPYSESIGFIFNHAADPEAIDMVTYVTAHEIAHQWWGHQVVPSDQQGGTMLVESFAQYSALLVMERMYGRDGVRRFLKYELDRYLRARGGEAVEELPLARVEDQGYIHYQKGTLAMVLLRDRVGQDTVDRALARLLQAHGLKGAPYPNTRDFLALLREEAGPQHDALITDLFERITLVDAKVIAATRAKRDDGRFDVTVTVEARKLQADGQGRETEVPLEEPFDIGAFTAMPGTSGFTPEAVLFFEQRIVRTGTQELRFVTDKAPAFVGVDPYNKRIDRNSNDNLKAL